MRGRSAHRVRPLSTDPHRQELSVNGVSASFGLGTPSTWQLALPRRTSSVGTSNQCLLPKLPRLRAPVLACSRCVQEACASCETVVFGDRRVAGGGGVHSAHLRFSGPYSPLIRGLRSRQGCYPRRGRYGRPLTSVSPPSNRFSLDHGSRLRVGPPGRGPPRSASPTPCDRWQFS